MSYRGYPETDPEGRPWTLMRAVRAYGVPVPQPVIEMANCRTRPQYDKEAYEARIQSARNWAGSREALRHDAMAAEWEATHGER